MTNNVDAQNSLYPVRYYAGEFLKGSLYVGCFVASGVAIGLNSNAPTAEVIAISHIMGCSHLFFDYIHQFPTGNKRMINDIAAESLTVLLSSCIFGFSRTFDAAVPMMATALVGYQIANRLFSRN